MNGLSKRLGTITCSFTLLLSIMLFFLAQTVCAQEATAINISEELSITQCLQGDALWVNGTATYDNSTPCANSEVFIQIKGNRMNWTTLTDSNGDYKMQIAATGRFIDQIQPEVIVPFGYTDAIKSGNRVGQTFVPNASKIYSLDIYIVKFFPSPSSSLTVHLRGSTETSRDMGNATLTYDEVEDGWNLFTFSEPIELVPGEEYFILVSSNTTSGSYNNYGAPWGSGSFYENGTVYWEGDPMVKDPDQDIGFITYYEEPLEPGNYFINVSVTGQNSSGALFGYNETTLEVLHRPTADLYISPVNIQLKSNKIPPLAGDQITVKANIKNLGDADAEEFLVNFSLDLKDNVFESKSVTIYELQEGITSATFSTDIGEHTIFVFVDTTEIISEISERNNNASITIFVDGDHDGDSVGNLSDPDDDNDGYSDTIEISEGTDPLNPQSKPVDNDGDFLPDSMDLDNDNDGYSNEIELTIGTDPLDNTSVPDDYDLDLIPDSMDPDMDNDTIPNEEDAFPLNCSEWRDTDFDGIGDNADTDDDADGTPDDVDPYPLDTDDDGLANFLDWDDDADGILDWEDKNLLDTDNDGLKNDVDKDDDGDGLSDLEEEKKHTNPLKVDTDGDGVSDKDDYDPLDSEVTSDPGIPLIYLVVPLLIIIVFILVFFFATRRGSRIGAAGVGEGFRELPADKRDYGPFPEPQTQEGRPLAYEAEKPPPSDELAELEEEFEEPTAEEEKDELADIEEEFEETL
ncbi:MAG: hypothetical protein JSW00_09255 [Thermoplasmata archaeon]|nr:MAG: hypothetical protein JSW00_09255 [Thermoplasmata archaeon]